PARQRHRLASSGSIVDVPLERPGERSGGAPDLPLGDARCLRGKRPRGHRRERSRPPRRRLRRALASRSVGLWSGSLDVVGFNHVHPSLGGLGALAVASPAGAVPVIRGCFVLPKPMAWDYPIFIVAMFLGALAIAVVLMR